MKKNLYILGIVFLFYTNSTAQNNPYLFWVDIGANRVYHSFYNKYEFSSSLNLQIVKNSFLILGYQYCKGSYHDASMGLGFIFKRNSLIFRPKISINRIKDKDINFSNQFLSIGEVYYGAKVGTDILLVSPNFGAGLYANFNINRYENFGELGIKISIGNLFNPTKSISKIIQK